MSATVIHFRGNGSRFRLDLTAFQLWRDPGERVALSPKQFDLLYLLASHPKRLFSKDELIAKLWADDDPPGDDVLARTVSDVRRALGDDAFASTVIATVPRRGYRFDADLDLDVVDFNSLPVPRSTAVDSPRPSHTPETRFQAWHRAADAVFALTPVQHGPRLVGREFELWVMRNQLRVAGQHVLLYGPPGVGKTSLANVLAGNLTREESRLWCRTEVNDSDSFDDVSRKIRKAIRRELGVTAVSSDSGLSASELADEFAAIAGANPFVLIVDEFQRKMSRDVVVGISELLKALGDRRAQAQFVLVGVAENIQDLIGAHESLVLRHLLPIRVEMMTRPTTKEIVSRGFRDLSRQGWPDLDSSLRLDAIAERITVLSLGLPTMVNEIARETARVALDSRSPRVTEADFDNALLRLTSKYSEELGVDFRGQLAHDPYLVACAATRTDKRGSLAISGVAATFEKLKGEATDAAHTQSRLAVHLRTGLLKIASDENAVQFALNLLPSRLLVAAVAERALDLDRLAAVWRHSTDQILDELEYQMFECLRLADNGDRDKAIIEYTETQKRLLFAMEHVSRNPGYLAQRERLEGLKSRSCDLARMIDIGEGPSVG